MISEDDSDHGRTLPAHAVPKAPLGPVGTRLRMVPTLSPLTGAVRSPVKIVGNEFQIGRGEGSQLELKGRTVSRVHARIVVKDDEFVLEDLGSNHGTFLDGVPVVSCVLRDGDLIQIGTDMFYFDRVFELPSAHREA